MARSTTPTSTNLTFKKKKNLLGTGVYWAAVALLDALAIDAVPANRETHAIQLLGAKGISNHDFWRHFENSKTGRLSFVLGCTRCQRPCARVFVPTAEPFLLEGGHDTRTSPCQWCLQGCAATSWCERRPQKQLPRQHRGLSTIRARATALRRQHSPQNQMTTWSW